MASLMCRRHHLVNENSRPAFVKGLTQSASKSVQQGRNSAAVLCLKSAMSAFHWPKPVVTFRAARACLGSKLFVGTHCESTEPCLPSTSLIGSARNCAPGSWPVNLRFDRYPFSHEQGAWFSASCPMARTVMRLNACQVKLVNPF